MPRKRDIVIRFHLTEEETNRFLKYVEKCGMSRERYLRMLIAGYIPTALPSNELIEVLKQLRRIGVNMNQIAYKANAMGIVDSDLYHQNYTDLQNEIFNIKQFIAMPKEWRNEHGSDKFMGS